MDSGGILTGTPNVDKPRLSEQEKKNNHIQSEQKRRQAIREGFDELAELIPGFKGQGRSEAIVLEGATLHVKKLLAERYRLMTKASEKGLPIERWQMDEVTMQLAKEAAEQEDADPTRKRG